MFYRCYWKISFHLLARAFIFFLKITRNVWLVYYWRTHLCVLQKQSYQKRIDLYITDIRELFDDQIRCNRQIIDKHYPRSKYIIPAAKIVVH